MQRTGPRSAAAIILRMTTEEKELLLRAATMSGHPVATWIRQRALAVARAVVANPTGEGRQ